MAIVNNLIPGKLHPVTGEDLRPTVVTVWQDGTTPMTDALCGGLYNKDTEASSPTFGSYFKWNAAGPWPVSRLTTITQAKFQKLINDFGSNPATIVLDKTVAITSNMTIPANVKIDWVPGATFNISTGVVLTLLSTINEQNQQLFSGLGNVILNVARVNVKWFGAVDDFNTTTLTGTDNTVAFEKATNAIIDGRSSVVVVPRGRYGLLYYIVKNVSLIGEGRVSFSAMTSSEPSFFRLMEGTVRDIRLENFNLSGNPNNPGQVGFDATAIYSPTENTGGWWYSSMSDVNIRGFLGHQMNFTALDPNISGTFRDIANQFLTFNRVTAFRSNATTRALRANGQFGQIQFNGCEFDGAAENTLVDSVNVELISSVTTGDTDQIYSVDFNLCTFQNGDKGVRTSFVKTVNLNGCHFENLARPIYIETGSQVNVLNNYFGACGLGSRITNATIEGCLAYVGSTCEMSFDGCAVSGAHDFTIIGDGLSGVNYGSANKFVPTYKTIDYQGSVTGAGVLTINSHSGRILVNATTTELNTISSTKGVGNEIVLTPLGTLTLNVTGNIAIPIALTKLIFRAGQLITLRRRGAKWDVINVNDSFFTQFTGSPEGVIVAAKSTIGYRTDASVNGSVYFKSIEDAGANNTGWIAITPKIIRTLINATPKTANYTITADDSTILYNATSGNLNATLPSASSSFSVDSGRIYTIKKTDATANTVTVVGSIDGGTNFVLRNQNEAITVQSTGTDFKIIDYYNPNVEQYQVKTASGTGVLTTINIAHGLGYTPVLTGIVPNNAASNVQPLVTADATNFIFNYAVAPASGTNNLSYNISYKR